MNKFIRINFYDMAGNIVCERSIPDITTNATNKIFPSIIKLDGNYYIFHLDHVTVLEYRMASFVNLDL